MKAQAEERERMQIILMAAVSAPRHKTAFQLWQYAVGQMKNRTIQKQIIMI